MITCLYGNQCRNKYSIRSEYLGEIAKLFFATYSIAVLLPTIVDKTMAVTSMLTLTSWEEFGFRITRKQEPSRKSLTGTTPDTQCSLESFIRKLSAGLLLTYFFTSWGFLSSGKYHRRRYRLERARRHWVQFRDRGRQALPAVPLNHYSKTDRDLT